MDCQTREEALRRLGSIEGHVRAIGRMVDEDCCCLDIIRQTLAVRRALARVSQLLVLSQLRGCVTAGAEDGASSLRTIDELLKALDLSERS